MAELTDVGIVEVDTADMTDDDMLAGRQGAVAGLARYTLGKLKAYFLSGGATLPPGGTAGQVLTKIDGTDGNADWEDPTGGGGGGSNVIRFGSFFTTEPGADETLMGYPATDAFTLPADLDGSEFKPMAGSTNPGSTVVLSLQLNGVEFGTVSISAAGAVTFDSPETDIAVEDVITLVAPADSDGLAGWAYSFRSTGDVSGGGGSAVFRGARVHLDTDYVRAGGSDLPMLDAGATVDFDTDSFWDAANQRFTIPAGVNFVEVTAQRAVTGGGVGFRVNASIGGVTRQFALAGDTSPEFFQGTSGPIAVSEGDWVRLDCYNGSGYTLKSTDEGWTWGAIKALG